ncbi:hypothetical protein AADG42_18280 [Ammonicoccus fulvus]|uniref:DUF4352 domain-containing protein n=1 Tax=Ammonicoccus fulvus TaxID=3138240 RepID=A0ABZ3FWK8_9ACTN
MRRLRAWLALWTVLMISVVYVAGWAFWATIHQNTRFVQLPPGEGVTTDNGSTLRVLSITRAAEIPTKYSEVKVPAEGAVFVIVQFEATVTTDKEICPLRLVGRDGRTWEETQQSVFREHDRFCMSYPLNQPTIGEIVYEIPRAEADHLGGVYHQYLRDWRRQVYAMSAPQ